MRAALCLALLLCGLAQADQVDDAARALGLKIAAHVAPQERVHLTVRNISGLPGAEADRAAAALEGALPKHPRAKRVMEVSLTFSENVAGYLWVAQIREGEVEMVAVSSAMSAAAPERQMLTKRLVWEQSAPLLDFVQQGERTVILTNSSVAVIQGNSRTDALLTVPPVRDPRGHLELEGNALAAYFPGATCRGTAEPLHLDCDSTSAEFVLNGETVRFTPGRNTIAGIRAGDETTTVCEGMKLAAIKEDAVALIDASGAVLQQAELPGPVTALWPASAGAVVVIRNRGTEQYAAYMLSVDCSSR